MSNGDQIAGAITNTGNAMAISVQGRKNQERANKYNKESMAISQQYAQQNAQLSHQLGLDAWEKTSYKAQKEQMLKAGLNPALMYKGSGAGGQLAQPAVSAGGAMATPMPEELHLGGPMEMAQISLLQAQKENIQADTANKTADATFTGGAKTDNTTTDTKGKQISNEKEEPKIKYAEANAQSEALQKDEDWRKTEWENRITQDQYNDKIDKLKAETTNEEIRSQILKAEQEVKEFEAKMTRQGIPPNSPWYAKLLGDLLDKMGILDLLNGGKQAIKGEIQK